MENRLEQKIMKQVIRMYYLKKVFNPFMFEVYTLVIAIVSISSLVSITNIIANMPSLLDVGSVYTFVSSAVTNTGIVVQIVLGISVVVGVLLIKDTIKNFSYSTKLTKVHQV